MFSVERDLYRLFAGLKRVYILYGLTEVSMWRVSVTTEG